jgi:hypothetical protein
MLEFVGRRPGAASHRAVHAAASRKFRARDLNVEPLYGDCVGVEQPQRLFPVAREKNALQ